MIKSNKSEDIEYFESVIAKLIMYMGAEDMAELKNFQMPVLHDKSTSNEKVQAQRAILSNHYRDTLDRVLLRCLKVNAHSASLPLLTQIGIFDLGNEGCCYANGVA